MHLYCYCTIEGLIQTIHPEKKLRLMKDFILKIIEKPERGQMGQTQCHVNSLKIRDATV